MCNVNGHFTPGNSLDISKIVVFVGGFQPGHLKYHTGKFVYCMDNLNF